MEVRRSRPALEQLDKALDFIIEQGFVSYASELEENIISRVENLVDSPALYPVDKYKKGNDGSYHAFEVDEYRVSYRITKSLIKIIRVRHTSGKTRKY
ncbi:MAG: hypothetical protein NVSMB24_15640 [Mucilaginibacter sp.]